MQTTLDFLLFTKAGDNEIHALFYNFLLCVHFWKIFHIKIIYLWFSHWKAEVPSFYIIHLKGRCAIVKNCMRIDPFLHWCYIIVFSHAIHAGNQSVQHALITYTLNQSGKKHYSTSTWRYAHCYMYYRYHAYLDSLFLRMTSKGNSTSTWRNTHIYNLTWTQRNTHIQNLISTTLWWLERDIKK